ncbi:5-carboxymethyl-2-hydroxymuconate Delta-isomerase [Microbulbifer sp. OS29]|uniref:5-carboxymethyl-2-hydroxymuconate Delta-isomerase n=1 Tax=Microbulbifer okhotskensis TaxID=2926617 RepID=A0A9X2EPT7_9GAMM|nr:5-carboxymethyl-2-hydroxymuconate Delta-isomerase [Microbulbifer okhotskensis]MCO1336167.1 5-carboxymethyl-2-hydroxymuconate Delta-isomerase [Microbulbifer okhotskensis]
MPHCVIQCPSTLLESIEIPNLLSAIHRAADQSSLFEPDDIKVRLLPVQHYLVGPTAAPFVHVECSLLSGRTTQQRQTLAQLLAKALCAAVPDVKMLSVEVREIVRAAYCNRASLEAAV